MAKNNSEKKLLKLASKSEALERELQLVFPPKIFEAIVDLAKMYMAECKNDSPSRDRVAKLAFLIRQETFARFGHDSLETIILAKAMRGVNKPWAPPAPRLDSISHMRTYHKARRLDAQQEAAAEMIRKVWDAFGRFRFIAARGMEGGGGGGGQAKQPLDVMGQDLWEHYQKHYIPWYKHVATISVNRRRYALGQLSLAAICFKILVEEYFPEEVDAFYGLLGGTSYKALNAALTGYFEPKALQEFVERRRESGGDEGSAPKAAKPA